LGLTNLGANIGLTQTYLMFNLFISQQFIQLQMIQYFEKIALHQAARYAESICAMRFF